jgi:peroxiredoxin
MSEPLVISHLALWLLVTIQGLVLLGVVHALFRTGAQGALNVDRGDLDKREAPDFTAKDIAGATVSSSDLADRMRVFLFVSPNCSRCNVTLGELEALEYKADGNVVIVCQSQGETCRKLIDMYGLGYRVLIDDERRLSKAFGVFQVPAAVLVNEKNRIEVHGKRIEGVELEALLQKTEQGRVEEVVV